MGVKELLFFHSFKVEKSYWQSPRIQAENYIKDLTEALEQCGDTVTPQIRFCSKFKDFTEGILQDFSRNTQMIFGDPSASDDPLDYNKRPVTLIVGPEGGFTEYETGKLRELNAAGVTLGPRILRTEYALAALLGKLS